MLHGHVDNITRDRIAGWAADFTNTKRPVPVTVLVDGKPLLTLLAQERRNDVEEAFGKQGLFGFSVELDVGEVGGKTIEVCFADTGQVLENGTRSFFANSDNVVIGKNGWYFQRYHEEIPVFPVMTGSIQMKDVDVAAHLRSFQMRQRYLTERLDYLFCIIPDKTVIYDEHLPNGSEISVERPVLKLMNSMSQVFYPECPLKSLKGVPNLYHKTDTHLNDRGVALVHQLLVLLIKERFGIAFDNLPAAREVENQLVGDLSHESLENVGESIVSLRYDRPDADILKKNNVTGYGTVRRYTRAKHSGPKVMISGTSSGLQLARLFSYVSPDVLFIFHDDIDYDILDQFRPDILLSVVQERMVWRRPMMSGCNVDASAVF